MIVTKISGTRSYILVEFDHRSIKILGELTTSPTFYADFNSIKKWEPPFDFEEITEEKKQQLVNAVLDYSANKELKIHFD